MHSQSNRTLLASAALASLALAPLAAADNVPFFERLVRAGTPANGANRVIAVDLDGDGDRDLISTAGVADRIEWHENDGNDPPVFAAHAVDTAADAAGSVWAADMNGDGDLDIVAGDADGVYWYESDGANPPLFAKHTIVSLTPTGQTAVVFPIDYDGNGAIDVLFAYRGDTVFGGAFNDGNDPPVFFVGAGPPTPSLSDLWAANAEADIDIDILLTYGSTEVVWFLSGPATFHSVTGPGVPATRAITADINADGDLDVLIAEPTATTISWYESNGADPPGYTRRIVSTDAGAVQNVWFGDLDDDGDLDVVGASSDDDTYAWYDSDGADPPAFTKHIITDAAGGATGIFAADVNSSGRIDVIGAAASDRVISWFDNRAIIPTFTPFIISDIVDGAGWVRPADIDSDGDFDVISAAYLGDTVAWHDNNGVNPPTFTERVISDTAYAVFEVAAADVNDDGHLDVLSASFDDDTVAWYENLGQGIVEFSHHVVTDEALGAVSVDTADIDANGDLDVVSGSHFDNTVAWHASDGGGPPFFTENEITDNADDAFSVHAADIDDDGDIDILAASEGDDTLAWFESDGAMPPAFTEIVLTESALGAGCVTTADLDADGDLDIVLASYLDHTVRWFEHDGAAEPAFTEHIITSSAIFASTIYVADLDLDERLDVLCASEGDDTLAWYENEGGDPPTFAEHIISSTVDGVLSVAAADMDGDGDTDVLSASYWDDSIRWWSNDIFTLPPTPACPGDANGDGGTDVFDFANIAAAFGSSIGDPSYIPEADIAPVGAPDGVIDIQDFGVFSSDFGCTP